MNTFFPILTATIFLFLASCETTIEVDLPKYTPKLVVNGFFSPDTFWQISVTNTVNILDINEPGNVVNAVVKIKSADGEIELYNSYNGLYKNQQFKPQIGKPYTLQVTAQGYEDISSTNIIPSPPQVISLDTTHTLVTDDYGNTYTIIEFDLSILDDPNADNYYYLALFDKSVYNGITRYNERYFETQNPAITSVHSGDSDNITFSGSGAVFSDFLFNGEQYKIKFTNDGSYRTSGIAVGISSISKEFFLFKKSLYRSTDDAVALFSEPEPPYTNIQNGLGVFAGFNTTFLELK